ncbi:MAG: hypothetical protein C0484_02600 [Rhodospirillum sp.]|nr:hypothetical protein [Rhodospirillum sp.]
MLDNNIPLIQLVELLVQKGVRPPDISATIWRTAQRAVKASASIDDQLYDALQDSIEDNLECRLSVVWDGEGPAHNGNLGIYEWMGFFFFRSSDHDGHGPFRTIDDALALDYFDVENVPNGELDFDDTVPEQRAMKIALSMCGSNAGSVTVNGRRYKRDGDHLIEVHDELKT